MEGRKEHKQDSKKCKNKIVDILFRAHGAFLEYHSSATFKVDRLESQLIKNLLGTSKPKEPTQDTPKSAKITYARR